MTLSAPRSATDADFPRDAPVAEQLEAMLNWAVLAPSVLNTQPWTFAVDGDTAFLFADRARQLPNLDPDGRELAVSCGAALFNLRLAARHFGYATVVERVPDPESPDLLATLRLAGAVPATEDQEALFHEVKHRRTNRSPFAEMPIPTGLLRDFREVALEEGAHLLAITDEETKAEIAALVAAGIRAQGTHFDTADEIRRWLRADHDPRRDGVPDGEQAGWDRASTLRTDAARYARQIQRLTASAPALLVLTTDADTPEAWLHAGEALQHVLLLAARHDVSASYLNQPVEEEPLRERLAALVGGTHPQVVFRVGFTSRVEGTPRRAVGDVITSVPPTP